VVRITVEDLNGIERVIGDLSSKCLRKKEILEIHLRDGDLFKAQEISLTKELIELNRQLDSLEKEFTKMYEEFGEQTSREEIESLRDM